MGCGSSSESSPVQQQPPPQQQPAGGGRPSNQAQVASRPTNAGTTDIPINPQNPYLVKQAFQAQQQHQQTPPQQAHVTRTKTPPQATNQVQEKPSPPPPAVNTTTDSNDETEEGEDEGVAASNGNAKDARAAKRAANKAKREASKAKLKETTSKAHAIAAQNAEAKANGVSPMGAALQMLANAQQQAKSNDPEATKTQPDVAAMAAAYNAPPEPVIDDSSSSPATAAEPITEEVAACDEGDLFVLKLTGPETAEELSVVQEINPFIVKVSDVAKGGPGELNEKVAALSWRWDIKKPKTLEEAKKVAPSPKIVQAIRQARADGFKWAWIDWMVVPQYPADEGLTINHVRGSRLVYEKCSVLIVDLVEVVKGVKAPTPDYISRLWTTAEMSSMLSNPHVNYSTFVKLEKLNHVSITTAAMATFSGHTTRDNYVSEYLTYFKDKKYETQNLSQDSIHMVCYNLGVNYLTEKYGRNLPIWLCSNLQHLVHREPVPLTEAEQEKLIQDYYEAGEKGHENPYVKPILDAVSKSKKMPKNFDFTAHYRGYLLLSSEVIRHLLKTWKFNAGCYKSVLQRLGEKFYNASTTTSPEDKLQCWSDVDVPKVRQMIMAARSRVKVPIALKGLRFHQVPMNHVFSTPYLIPNARAPGESTASFKNILPNCSFISSTSLDDASQPIRNIAVSCQANEFTRGLITCVDFYTPYARIGFVVQANGECNAIFDCGSSHHLKRCAVNKYGASLPLGPDEIWFDMHFTYTDSALVTKTLSLSLKTKMMTMDQLLQVQQGFENVVKELMKSCPTEGEKLKAVGDESRAADLKRVCDQVGLITTPVPTQAPLEDPRPEYTPEEAAEAAAAAKAKEIADAKKAAEAAEKAKARAAQGLPEEPSEEEELEEMCKKFNMTPAMLKMMPPATVDQLKSSWAMMKNVKM